MEPNLGIGILGSFACMAFHIVFCTSSSSSSSSSAFVVRLLYAEHRCISKSYILKTIMSVYVKSWCVFSSFLKTRLSGSARMCSCNELGTGMQESTISKWFVAAVVRSSRRRWASGRFVKQEQWERWWAKRKLVSGSKHQGRFCGARGYHAQKRWDCIYIYIYMQNPAILCIFAGKWFSMRP